MSLARLENKALRLSFGCLGAALFLLCLGSADAFTRGALSLPALVPPFGASVVIVFFTPESPAGRPANVLGGHLSSAMMGVIWLGLLPHAPVALLAALAVTSAGLMMVATRTIHPPGGATALLTVLGGMKLGPALTVCSALVGSTLLVAVRMMLDGSLSWWLSRSVQALPVQVEIPDVLEETAPD